MQWHYARHGKQEGPVTGEELTSLAVTGQVNDGTLVWREGMKGWQPYGAIKPAKDTVAVPGAVTCSVCRRHLPPDEVIPLLGQTVCAVCKPTLLQGMREGVQVGVSRLWRCGHTLVMEREATLPACCFQCGEVAQGGGLKRRLYWHHPAIYLTILASLLIYAVVAVIVRKRADVTVNLCARHWQRRWYWLAVAWVGSLSGIGMMVWGIANESWFGLWGIVVLVGGLCAGNFGARVTYAKRIDDQLVWLRGAGPETLAGLPDWPGN